MSEEKKTGLALMREPFAENQISIMCRSTKKDNPKSKCLKCGGYHGMPAIQLSYVGHAALTDRLLEADPNWTWEPLAFGPDGYPVIDRDGGMWIKLTVCGVTRLGYGDAQGKTGGDAMKERIGDALRNAGMRFGAALELWHKGVLHVDDEGGEELQQEKAAPKPKQAASNSGLTDDAMDDVCMAMRECADLDALQAVFGPAYKKASKVQQVGLKKEYDKFKSKLTEMEAA